MESGLPRTASASLCPTQAPPSLCPAQPLPPSARNSPPPPSAPHNPPVLCPMQPPCLPQHHTGPPASLCPTQPPPSLCPAQVLLPSAPPREPAGSGWSGLAQALGLSLWVWVPSEGAENRLVVWTLPWELMSHRTSVLPWRPQADIPSEPPQWPEPHQAVPSQPH